MIFKNLIKTIEFMVYICYYYEKVKGTFRGQTIQKVAIYGKLLQTKKVMFFSCYYTLPNTTKHHFL